MSKTMKWVIAIVVIIVIVLLVWWSGVFSGGQSSAAQPAAAVIPTTQNAPAMSPATLASDSAEIVQINAALQQNQGLVASAGTSPATTTVIAVVASTKSIVTSMSGLGANLQSQLTSSGLSSTVMKTLQASLQDMIHQVSNANSQITAASNNATAPKAVNGKTPAYSSTTMHLQAGQQLVAAQADLTAALKDAQAIVQGM